MKKILLLLSTMLVLTSCAAKKEPLGTMAASSSAESAPKIHEETEVSAPSGQQMAIDAYQAILNSFGGGADSGNFPEFYPEEFGDAYIGEDNFLYVCLTDVSDAVTSRYREAVAEPQVLRFVEVTHGYKDLYALQMALAALDGLEFSFIGVDVTGNKVDIGIPDRGKESAVRELMETALPEDVRNRFGELPVSIEEAGYATFG